MARPKGSYTTAWRNFALSQKRLTKASMKKYGLSPSKLRKIKSAKIIPLKLEKSLRAAYIHTQYNKLRRAGVSRKEAVRLSRKADPKRISQVAKKRREYADEMVFRHKAPTSKTAWRREVRVMLESMRRMEYRESMWDRFAEWYSKHMKKRFPFEKAAKKLKPTPVKHDWDSQEV